jgi:hypothetical protein
MCHECKTNLSSTEQKKAEAYGGFDLRDWIVQSERIGADKGSHRERSIFHQENHIEHWKKIERSENLWRI